jgi:transposase-like protein
VSMTGKIDGVEVITSVRRRRHWSRKARQHGIAPNQPFTWRLYTEGALSAVGRWRGSGGGLRVPDGAAAGGRAQRLPAALPPRTSELQVVIQLLRSQQPLRRD